MTINELIERAFDANIADVARLICGLELHPRGGLFECLCPNPNHNDRHMGNFSINPSNGWWGCFACDLGKHRGPVELVSRLCNMSVPEAALHICKQFNLVPATDYSELEEMVKRTKEQKLDCRAMMPKREKGAPKREPEHLHKVYTAFAAAAPEMTEEQKEKLKADRFLTDEDLVDFFFLPHKDWKFWNAFKAELEKAGLGTDLTEILTGVPGFSQYISSDRWTFCGAPGDLCLKSHDLEGRFIGLQIRLTKHTHGPKYVTFSSGTLDKEVRKNGCSSGIVADIIRPIGEKARPTVAVTEGKFKAIALAKMGCWAISIPGVNNWKYAKDIFKQVGDEIGSKKLAYMVAYDADMYSKPEVMKAAKSLVRFLTGISLHVFVAQWDEKYGKGIDDVVNNGNFKELSHVTGTDFLDTKIKEEV